MGVTRMRLRNGDKYDEYGGSDLNRRNDAQGGHPSQWLRANHRIMKHEMRMKTVRTMRMESVYLQIDDRVWGASGADGTSDKNSLQSIGGVQQRKSHHDRQVPQGLIPRIDGWSPASKPWGWAETLSNSDHIQDKLSQTRRPIAPTRGDLRSEAVWDWRPDEERDAPMEAERNSVFSFPEPSNT